MRNPDFSSLRYILECRSKDIFAGADQPHQIDYTVLANAITWLCKESLILGGREASSYGREAMHVMALLIEDFGPQVRIKQARRNLSITKKLSRVDRFSTMLSEEQLAIGDTENLSGNRVAKIYQGKIASTALVEFIESARKEKNVSLEQVVAAREALLKIRRRLMLNNSKGKELRSQICKGFGTVGKTILNEENYSDVEAHRDAGLSHQHALEAVAKASGQKKAKVKTDHQRIKAQLIKDIDDVVSIANKGAVVVDESGNTIHVFPAISRNDIRRN